MNYYEHHLGDWAAATGHLTWDEDMAYTRLLRAYYHHEQAIAYGQQYRLAKASTPAQRRAVDQVLSEFFELRDGRYHQKRADAEIARYQDKQAKARRSAEARWNVGKTQTEGNANASADAMRTHSEGNALQTPDTRHQRNTPPTPKGEPPGFAAFWSAWPRSERKGGKAQCLKTWEKSGLENDSSTIVAHVVAMAQTEGWTKQGGAFVPAPLVYLNGRRWDGAELNGQQPSLQLVGAV